MLRYKKYQSNSSLASIKGKWFIRLVAGEQYDIAKLAEHMSAHNTPFSEGAIKGILTDMVSCIKELLLDGKTVKIGDLAIFSLGCHCSPALDEVSLTTNNIRAFSFNARGTGKCTTANFQKEAKMQELDKY